MHAPHPWLPYAIFLTLHFLLMKSGACAYKAYQGLSGFTSGGTSLEDVEGGANLVASAAWCCAISAAVRFLIALLRAGAPIR